VTAVQVIGEVLLTLGVLVGLYVVWQIWINDAVSDSSQHRTAEGYSQQWAGDFVEPDPSEVPKGPVVTADPDDGAVFANLIVPRFGDDYMRPIAEGTGLSVLNDVSRGMGHYDQTQLPGELGNFAIASHRTAYGGALHTIHELRVGDPVYVETQDGWYEYVYRNTEYVPPTSVDVIAPVPGDSEAEPTQRLITMTTCNPFYSSAERIIAYGVFTHWYPRADGPPAEIADLVTATGRS
jgi:sortase A